MTKLGIYAFILTTLIGFITWGYGQVYQAGYNSATASMQADHLTLLAEKEKEFQEGLAKAKDRLKASEAKASKLFKDLQTKPKVVYKDVVKVIESSSCELLGTEFRRMFNDQIDWVNHTLDGQPTASP